MFIKIDEDYNEVFLFAEEDFFAKFRIHVF